MAPIIEDWVSDSEDESEPNDQQSVPSFVQTSKHVKPFRHSIQPVEAPILTAIPKSTSPTTNCSGNFMPPKLDLVFHTAPIVVETDHSAYTVQLNPTKPT
nr:hypothetical protein [Tanacetum cinerariifolium]